MKEQLVHRLRLATQVLHDPGDTDSIRAPHQLPDTVDRLHLFQHGASENHDVDVATFTLCLCEVVCLNTPSH